MEVHRVLQSCDESPAFGDGDREAGRTQGFLRGRESRVTWEKGWCWEEMAGRPQGQRVEGARVTRPRAGHSGFRGPKPEGVPKAVPHR